jgi:hypothetical protein
MQWYTDPFQKKLLDVVDKVASRWDANSITLAMAKIEVTFKNGTSEILTVAATSGENGAGLANTFAKHLPADVYHLKTMVTPDRLLPNGKFAKNGHAEESIINWFYDAKDRLLNEKSVTLERGIFNDEGVKIGIEKRVLDHEKVAGIRVKDLAASRAICNDVCTQKVIDLDADMFKELSQADSTGVAEGAEKIQKMEKIAEQESQNAAKDIKKITHRRPPYVQEGINGLKAVHTPTPFERLVNPKLK